MGAMTRYCINQLPLKNSWSFPANTLIANIIATFIIGLVVGYSRSHTDLDSRWLLLLQVGFCGGLSTLSSMTLEFYLMRDVGHMLLAMIYVTGSFAICLMATWLGLFLTGPSD